MVFWCFRCLFVMMVHVHSFTTQTSMYGEIHVHTKMYICTAHTEIRTISSSIAQVSTDNGLGHGECPPGDFKLVPMARMHASIRMAVSHALKILRKN